jgi:hypothetical protein
MHREMWRTPEKERPHNSVVCPAGDGMTPQWLNNFHDSLPLERMQHSFIVWLNLIRVGVGFTSQGRTLQARLVSCNTPSELSLYHTDTNHHHDVAPGTPARTPPQDRKRRQR